MPFDFDADDVFAYKVARRVIIRDRRLGIARALILIALFVYVVIYEVIIRRGYLQKDEPLGFATMGLRTNGEGSADHCCPLSAGCGAGATGNTAFGSDRGKLECVMWDRHNIIFPSSEEYSILITTRVTVSTSQELPQACILNRTTDACAPWEYTNVAAYYTRGVEEMTLRVDHGVYGKETNKVIRSQDMHEGVMVDYNDDKLYSICGSDQVGFAQDISTVSDTLCTDRDRVRVGDIFTVKQLMTIAGIGSLDSKTADIKTNSDKAVAVSPDTIRYDGIVILVLIGYEGRGIDTELSYTYRAFPLRGLEYKTEQVLFRELPNGNVQRIVWNRHGVRVILASAGYVAVFSFVELMKTLMVAGGLLSIAKFFVEVFLIRVLPVASVYKRYRDVKTVDFSDFSKEDLKQLSDNDYCLGVVRNDGKGTGAIHADDEREIGDKLDSAVHDLELPILPKKGNDSKDSKPPSPQKPGGSGASLMGSASNVSHSPTHNGSLYEQPLLPKREVQPQQPPAQPQQHQQPHQPVSLSTPPARPPPSPPTTVRSGLYPDLPVPKPDRHNDIYTPLGPPPPPPVTVGGTPNLNRPFSHGSASFGVSDGRI